MLKTLKDLDDYGMEVCRTLKRELKAEAIKWVKCDDFRFEDGWDCFKMFHNITEGDLK